MKSTSESGHARNVANFSVLVEKCASFGSAYNPSRPELRLEAMRQSLEVAARRMDEFHGAQSTNTLAVAEREKSFSDFGRKVTRVHNALKASASSDQIDERATSLVQVLRGGRRSPAPTAVGESATSTEPKPARSNSHASYDMRLDQLDRYLSLLGGIPDYTPNEPDLQLPALERWNSDLEARNTAVVQSSAALEGARTARDAALYGDRTGLADLSADCKSYLKSLYGATGPEYLMASRIRITRNG